MPDPKKLSKRLTQLRNEVEDLSKDIEFVGFLGNQREDYPVEMLDGVIQILVEERTQIFRQLDLLLPQFTVGKIFEFKQKPTVPKGIIVS